jgi:nitrate reductase alpha subunit
MSAEARVTAAHEFFRRGEANAEGWSMLIAKGRGWESAYRDRWRHDKVVRSTHGVNCTGSCSWNVYVKDGLITWESQAVDYPRTDAGRPDHEPRRVRRRLTAGSSIAGPPTSAYAARPRAPTSSSTSCSSCSSGSAAG